jgi:hypothetical protein
MNQDQSKLEIKNLIAVVMEFHPRIGNALTLFWGEKEFIPYIENLLNDTRDGTRQGFNKPVSEALIKLQDFYDSIYPRQEAKATKWDAWSESCFGRF